MQFLFSITSIIFFQLLIDNAKGLPFTCSAGKEFACNAGDPDSIPGLGRFPGISSVQFSSVTQSCPGLCDPMNRSIPGLPVQHHLLEFTQTHVHQVHDTIQPSHPLSSPSPPALNPSQHQSLSSESTLRMRWPKCWSFSFSIIPSKEFPGLISFRMDWLDLLTVQGTLKSLL